MGRLQPLTVLWFFERPLVTSNDFERYPTQDFKGTTFFDVECLRNSTGTRSSTDKVVT